MDNNQLPKKKNWVLIILVLISLYLLSAIMANFVGIFSTQPSQSSGNVAIIPIKGPISADGTQQFLSVTGTSASTAVQMVEKASDDDRIQAVILEINSPGGTAVASEEIARAVKRLNKTTVAWIREVGASGGYWVASSADHVVASRASVTGSIGVIGSYLEYSELLDRINITYQRLVSGEYKDLGSPLKELTPDERRLLEDKIDGLHEYFVDVVAENRNMTQSEVDDMANGLIYFGDEALELGLIDELGGRQEAIAHIEKDLNITAKTVSYQRKVGFIDIIGGLFSQHGYWMGRGFDESLKEGSFIART